MKIYIVLIFSLILTNLVKANSLYYSSEYELNFNSDSISLDKEFKINEIKILSFNKILKNILTNKEYSKFKNKIIISFVDKFILNLKINDEKIIGNKYYAKIKINFNEEIINQYLIDEKIKFINYEPNKFLLIVLEEEKFKKNLLSNNNLFFKKYLFLQNNINLNYFLMPNLDFNDRFILSIEDFLNLNYEKFKILNNKYQTNNILLIHSVKNKDTYSIKSRVFIESEFHNIGSERFDKIDFEIFFKNISELAIDKWKNLNQLDPTIINSINCSISTNNNNELKFVRNALNNNIYIKKYNLDLIKLNQNKYNINFYGNFNSFNKSLLKSRMFLKLVNNHCLIKII